MLGKTLIVILLSILLFACGGHGYEGRYESMVVAKGFGEITKILPKTTLYIGSDYIETDGRRVDMRDIYVKELDGNKYLVLVSDDGDDMFIIEPDGSMFKNMGLRKIKFTKVD